MPSEPRTRIWPGKPSPLGATWDGQGVQFALHSEHAESVELCLFASADDPTESERVPLTERTGPIWHGYLPDARPGLVYGYRVHGPWAPEHGQRFNPHKLLVDPYAKALVGDFRWDDALYAYEIGHADADLSFDERDSAPCIPRSMVVDDSFAWGDDRPPRVPWSHTVIYEAHVRSLTMRHPEVPEAMRGSYLGLASEPVVDHLLALGVTAVELLPVHAFVSERRLVEHGLVNAWGYNTLGFFAPHGAYASGDRGEQVSEFKTMVKKLHAAGIEVILDVVYNHTAEGDHLGPNLCLRGVDNSNAYHLVADDPRHYMDYTGCGNSLNVSSASTLRLVMDSLRYWVGEMHVDGFRFDLAPALGRGGVRGDFDLFFEVVRQDPVLGEVKLIAEPWDVGPDGYQLGRFPSGWAEWNGRYRDSVRRFWRGDDDQVAELASRLSGSSDLYSQGPNGSINFITCHDGYTLHDLVSYEHKHNEGNLEDNQDGHDDNGARNWGAEGETADEAINALRDRMKRNLLATLVLSQGVPMLQAGDELGRTQNGNNNAYCQDELTWIDWELGSRDRELLAFTKLLLELHRKNPALRRRAFFHGQHTVRGLRDVTWLRKNGTEMRSGDWTDERNHVLGMLLDGDAADEKDERGVPLRGDTLLVLLNGGEGASRFTLPQVVGSGGWIEVLDTSTAESLERRLDGSRTAVTLSAHTLLLLRHHARGR